MSLMIHKTAKDLFKRERESWLDSARAEAGTLATLLMAAYHV